METLRTQRIYVINICYQFLYVQVCMLKMCGIFMIIMLDSINVHVEGT